MNLIDVLLLQFCHPNPEREKDWMKVPHLYNGHVYATNRICMMKVPADRCGESYNTFPGIAPINSIRKVEDWYTFLKKPIAIPVQDITEVLSRFEKVYPEKVCPECHGEGEVSEGGETWGCLYCAGYGDIEDTKAAKVYPFDHHAVKVSRSYLRPFNVGLVEKAAQELGVHEVTLIAAYTSEPFVFNIDGIEITIMPLLADENTDMGTVHELILQTAKQPA